MIKKPKVVNEFKEFLKEYKVLSVAVAFVMGQAVNDLVKSFVTNIFMPLLSPVLPGGGWQEATLTWGKINLAWGTFLANAIHFLILAFIIFIVVKKLLAEPEPKTDKN
jgi:large conductance mechanosensitive channel